MKRVFAVLLMLVAACGDQAPPRACAPTLPDAIVNIGESTATTLCFEAEALPITYEAASSDEAVAQANAGGTAGWVRIVGVGVGEAIITITATDNNGNSAYQTVHITVPNRPPEVLKDIGDTSMSMWSERRFYLPDHIHDLDSQPLEWNTKSSGGIELRLAGDTLIVIAVERGWAELDITGSDTEGATADISIVVQLTDPIAYVTQAAHSRRNDTPLLAGRDGLLRLFLSTEHLIDAPLVSVTLMIGDEVTLVKELRSSGYLPLEIDEGQLSQSYNLDIAGEQIVPGLTVDIDIARTTDPAVADRIRIPLEVYEVPPIPLTLVPVVVTGDERAVPVIDEMVREGLAHESFSLMRSVLPLSGVAFSAHEPVEIQESIPLILTLRLLWEAEGRDGYYMGLTPGLLLSGNLNLGGQAFRPGWVSWAVMDLPIPIAHEFGHNLSLAHAPCGGAAGVDPMFPYNGGHTGGWGYDFEQQQLVRPGTYDLMSYCSPAWISDYHYGKSLLFQVTRASFVSSQRMRRRADEPVLAVWGMIDSEGTPSLLPALYLDGAPSVISQGDYYRLIGWTEDETVAFDYSFEPEQIADGEQSFVHFLPVTWSGDLDRISIQGPGGFSELDAETDQPLSVIIRDGQVRSISTTEVAGATIFSRGIPRRR